MNLKKIYNMEFFSEAYFLEQAGKIQLFEQRQFSDSAKNAPWNAKFDVFLSYNIKNIDAVKAIYYVLTKKGLKVYLDCIVDPDMKRDNCGRETARRIQNRLLNSVSYHFSVRSFKI